MARIIGLIGGASGKELTKQIQNFGYEVALIVGRQNEPGCDIAEHVLVTDLNNVEEVYQFLSTLGVQNMIIGTGHRFAFKLGEYLQTKGIMLNVNIRASEIAKEKRLFKDNISEMGFLTPTYISIQDNKNLPPLDSIVEKVGLPCVVKATIDTMLPQKANTVEELDESIRDVLASGSPAVVEQFIKGVDITVFVAAHNGKAKALPICYYSKAEDNDMKGFSNHEYISEKLSPDVETEVLGICEKLVVACCFEGLPRVDLMVLPTGEAYILETNSVGVTGVNERHAAYCRGTVLALREIGIDVAEIAVETALKKFCLIEE